MFKTTDDVDWNAVEQHYSHYSPQELEEMTYPKKHQRHFFTEVGDFQQKFRNFQVA